jgi:hypothetical protein
VHVLPYAGFASVHAITSKLPDEKIAAAEFLVGVDDRAHCRSNKMRCLCLSFIGLDALPITSAMLVACDSIPCRAARPWHVAGRSGATSDRRHIQGMIAGAGAWPVIGPD